MSLTGNPSRWARAVMILTYDEHGGFFDHCSPLPIVTNPPRGAKHPAFDSSGVRVPGLVISPLVPEGTVYAQPLDHTSILRFLAEKFGRDETYSDEVEQRSQTFTGQIADMLSRDSPREEVLLPPGQMEGENVNVIAFRKAAASMTDHDVNAMTNKFPELRGFIKGI